MGRFGSRFKKFTGSLKDKVEDVFDDVKEEVTEQVTEKISSIDWGDSFESIRATGRECHQVAQETVELCESTKSKSTQMIDFGREIQSTLKSFPTQVDASALETIKNLTDSTKLNQALQLAKDLDDVAVICIDKSVQLLDTMENGMESLPDVVQKAIDKAMAHGDDSDLDERHAQLTTLEKDIEDVKLCVSEVKDLNLFNAMKVGIDAFEQLFLKAKLSHELLASIQEFSQDVANTTRGLEDLNVRNNIQKFKDLWRIIKLSGLMRQFAEGTKKILDVLMNLFRAASDRISVLWAALAYAKDCMADCMDHIQQAKALCLDAHDKSQALIDNSRSIKGQLEQVGDLNAKSVTAVRNLARGGEIREAIKLARTMDDLVIECSEKVVAMVDRVKDGFANLPEIITEGINVDEDGKSEEDPEPPNVEEDVAELEASREAMENADVIHAVRTGVDGFSGVTGKVSICRDMLEVVQGFAASCNGTLDSFMNVWDLESAMDKIKEMCRMVRLGDMMKQFAQQIKLLIEAVIALLNTAIKKLDIDIKDVAGDVGETVQNVVQDVGGKLGDVLGGVGQGKVADKVEDVMDDAMDAMKNKFKKFW